MAYKDAKLNGESFQLFTLITRCSSEFDTQVVFTSCLHGLEVLFHSLS